VMRILSIVLASVCALAGCHFAARDSNGVGPDRVRVVFQSNDTRVDLLGVSGLDMGPMYYSGSYTPKYVGNKAYISYHQVSLEEKLTIRWRLSADHSKVFEQTVSRPHSVPEIIPMNRNVIFLHAAGEWTIKLE